MASASPVPNSYTQAAGKQFSCLTGGGSSSNGPVELSSQSFQPLVSLPSAPMSFAASPVTSAMNGGAWCPDSGASHHVTYDQSNLQPGVPYAGNNSLLMGDGAGVLIRHVGQGSLYTSAKPLFLQNLLHVPMIKKNLLSVSQLTRDNNVFFEFHANGCYVKGSQTQNVLLEGRLTHEGLYQLLPTVANKTFTQPSTSAEQSFPLLVSQFVLCSASSVPPVNLQESTTSLTCESSSEGLPLSSPVVGSRQNDVHSVLERPLEPEFVPCPGAEVLSNARAEPCSASPGGLLESQPVESQAAEPCSASPGGLLEMQPVESQVVSPHGVTTQHDVVESALEGSLEPEPALEGSLEPEPALEGSLEPEPALEGSLEPEPEHSLVDGVSDLEQSGSFRQTVVVLPSQQDWRSKGNVRVREDKQDWRSKGNVRVREER
ncbi:hypothetical protein GQ457_13G028300 [Hibiscus cannabinus]